VCLNRFPTIESIYILEQKGGKWNQIFEALSYIIIVNNPVVIRSSPLHVSSECIGSYIIQAPYLCWAQYTRSRVHRISRLLGLCINQFSLFLLHISIKIPPSSRKVKKVSVNGQGGYRGGGAGIWRWDFLPARNDVVASSAGWWICIIILFELSTRRRERPFSNISK
jgi:hypothetical protein